MKKMVMLLVLVFTTVLSAKQFPEASGIVLTDLEGKTYDIDELLDGGKHILIHQMYSG